MSRAVEERALPAWLFSPRMAVASGIAIAIGFTFAMGIVFGIGSWWKDVTQSSPVCFQFLAFPVTPGRKSFDGSDELPLNVERERAHVVGKVHKAEAACSPEDCPGPAQAAYQKAIRNYVDARGHAMTRLDISYGDSGVEWGQRFFDHPEDVQIVAGFRARHAAGLVDVDAMRRYAPAARMLLYRPATELLACRKG